MATQPVVTDTQPEVDEATGLFVYRYQPRDGEGQFIGKEYKYLYKDHQDLVRQITEGKEQGDRYIHEVKSGKRQVNGELATPRPTFQPAPESTEDAERQEREKFRQNAEKEFGAPLDKVRERLRIAGDLEEGITAQRWAMENEANGYYICPQNAREMMKYLDGENPQGQKLARIPANYDLAFEAVKDKLIARPAQEQAPPADSTQQPPPTQADARPRSTGVIPGQFQGTRPGAQAERRPLSAERFRQIDKMGRDEWMRFQRTNAKEAQAFLSMKHPAQPQQ